MSHRFISEAQVEEQKQKRLEAWNSLHAKHADRMNYGYHGWCMMCVDVPEEMPEEKYDPRTLYERLKEQRDLKEAEFLESIKLCNNVVNVLVMMSHIAKRIHKIDEDELAFYNGLDDVERQKEKRKREEDAKEMDKFKRYVVFGVLRAQSGQ